MVTDNENALRTIGEISRIYGALTDRKMLCEYFVHSVLVMGEAKSAHLFLAGQEGRLWLDASTDEDRQACQELLTLAEQIYQGGKSCLRESLGHHGLWVPLLTGSHLWGVACLIRDKSSEPFTDSLLDQIFDLASRMSQSLKSCHLHDKNLEMEKLSAVGKVTGMVLHEIKNVMQLATFAEDSLRRGLKEGSEELINRGYEGVLKANKETKGLVHEVLSLTQNYEIDPQKIDLKSLMRELEDSLRPKAEARSVELLFDVDSEIGLVEMEERIIYRALLNLIKNALEACQDKGAEVHVQVYPKGENYYQIVIKDFGMGMSDEVRARLGQTFFTTKGRQGTGLGMMVVRRALESHKASMHVESELGKGSAFTLTFPRNLV